MRCVVQRVQRARVTVRGETAGEIGPGLLVLLGVGQNDTEAAADYLADKVAGLRIFDDEAGRMNRAVGEVGGSVLVVSQFTLFGDVRRGKLKATPSPTLQEAADAFLAGARDGSIRNRSGDAYLTPALLDGRWMVRVSIGAAPTERADVETLWSVMRKYAER